MPHYLQQIAYSIEGWKALVKKPQNRIEAVRPAIEKLGGKIESAWFTFGDYDIVLIVEMPSNLDAGAIGIAFASGGASRDIAFCAHGILQPEVFVVEDARADDRFAANPMVTGGPKIRFYAGARLTTSDGHALGMLCVNSPVARTLSPEQSSGLQALSRQVMAQLDLRRKISELALARDAAVETALAKSQFLANMSHEIR